VLYVRLACLSKAIVTLCGQNLSINDGPDHLKFASYGPAIRQEHSSSLPDCHSTRTVELSCSPVTSPLSGRHLEPTLRSEHRNLKFSLILFIDANHKTTNNNSQKQIPEDTITITQIYSTLKTLVVNEDQYT
jgi:hypothetical protein